MARGAREWEARTCAGGIKQPRAQAFDDDDESGGTARAHHLNFDWVSPSFYARRRRTVHIMALRAVFREVRKAAARLDGKAVMLANLDADGLRRSMSLRAFILPEPFSPEAVAHAASPESAQWRSLMHYGAKRALRAQLDSEELLCDALTVLKELNQLDHELTSAATFKGTRELPLSQSGHASYVLHAASHAALAGVLDGSAPAEVEQRIEETIERLRQRALTLADQQGGDNPMRKLLSGVNSALFDEMRLRDLPPYAIVPAGQGEDEEVLEFTRASQVHRALDTCTGSSLALGLIYAEVLARCTPPSWPKPQFLALPRRHRPIATFNTRDGVISPVGAGAGRGGGGGGSRGAHEARVLVAVVDPSSKAAPTLLDPSAMGARTQLGCSEALIAAMRRSDAGWEAWAAMREADAAAELRQDCWAEVPETALLDQHGVMELTLRQLVDRFHAAGTPHSLRMHHRCAALLADLEERVSTDA